MDIEDLNVRGMLKNRHLVRAVSDMGLFELRKQLDYKAAQRGGGWLIIGIRAAKHAQTAATSSKPCDCRC